MAIKKTTAHEIIDSQDNIWPPAMIQNSEWVIQDINDLPDEVKRNYQRNATLINLDNVPEELEMEIMKTYKEAPCGDRSKLLNYFIKSRLKNLTNEIGEF